MKENHVCGLQSPEDENHVCGLQSPKDADYRLPLLNKIDNTPATTLQNLVEEYTRLVNLKKDTQMVEQKASDQPHTYALRTKGRQTPPPSFVKEAPDYKYNAPSKPCWLCGGRHFVRFCSYKDHECSDCGLTGHKEGFCDYSAQSHVSARPRHGTSKGHSPQRNSTNLPRHQKQPQLRSNGVFCISAETKSMRKTVTPLINNHSIQMQFDTGSDISILTDLDWKKLGSPTLNVLSTSLLTASDNTLKLSGRFACTVSLDGKQDTGYCYVSNLVSHSLLGIDWIEKLQLWNFFGGRQHPDAQQQSPPQLDVSSSQNLGVPSSRSKDQFDETFTTLSLNPAQIKGATKNDALLHMVTRSRSNRWPSEIYSARLRDFYNRRSTLWSRNGCLFSENRLVIPDALQSDVLLNLHEGHRDRCLKQLARQYVYWPSWDRDIETFLHQRDQSPKDARLTRTRRKTGGSISSRRDSVHSIRSDTSTTSTDTRSSYGLRRTFALQEGDVGTAPQPRPTTQSSPPRM